MAVENLPSAVTLADVQARNRERWEQWETGLPPDRSNFGPAPAPVKPLATPSIVDKPIMSLADLNATNERFYQSGSEPEPNQPWPQSHAAQVATGQPWPKPPR